MVNINTVYQTVLALANKEQRGYITPQEFNLFANQAQMSIFEQYFYDLNQFLRIPGNNTAYSDMVNLLEEKISLFEVAGATVGNGVTLPENLYKLQNVYWLNVTKGRRYTAEYTDRKSWRQILNVPLLTPTDSRLMYLRSANGLTVIGKTAKTSNVSCDYIKLPQTPNWTYAVINEKALYNPNATDHNHFELHESEQTELVIRILSLAGITLKDPNLYQIASTEESKQIQQQKS
tara:strand:+ start:1233 stop:1934 length:702 start_codon:yes stop_codon:yes gene_type:complete